AYLKAGEEMGIPREATLLALRERLAVPAQALEVGQTLFAPSVDGFWYPAVLVALAQHTATVRFLSGDEHPCALADLRPLSPVPGGKLEAAGKGWGWCGVEVQKYDAEKGKVPLTAGWSSQTLLLEKLRLSKKIAAPPRPEEKRLARLNRTALTRCAT